MAGVTLGGGVLGACSSGSSSLGHEACVHVQRSLAEFAAASRTVSRSVAAADRAKALGQLRAALQPAALAASGDGQWQALEATLSETNRVPESELVPALTAQCAGNGGPAGASG